MNGWIGVDFDGTLAEYDTWVSPDHCGKPIGVMVERVKRWLIEGREVRIFTARMYPLTEVVRPDSPPRQWRHGGSDRIQQAGEAVDAIRDWCREHIGQVLPITCVKDYGMIELYDDRAVQVRANTGEIVGSSTRGLL
jgi:hypothetical protein